MIRQCGVASIAGFVGGCALATTMPPRVDVINVQLREVGLLDQSLDVSLCVLNQNNTAMAFRRISISMDVAGAPLAEGVSEVSVQLPPHQAVLVPFAVATTTRNLGPQLGSILATGAVPYRLHGTAQLGGSLAFTVPFSRSGRLDLLVASQALLADATAPVGEGCVDAG